jgi:sugar lactone lactonase YvrE
MSLVRCVAEARNLVGEGPIWHPERQRLFWTDINGMKVHSIDPSASNKQIDTWQFSAPVSTLSRTSMPDWLLVAAGRDLLRWNPATGERILLAEVEDSRSGNRLNDGAADPEGNFWVGSMRNNVAPDGGGLDIDWNRPENRTGSLYRVTPDGAVTQQATSLGIPNTMLWSPGGRTLYTGDSVGNVLYAFDYERGKIAGRRIFTHGFARGVPDGSAIDEEGFLWNCRYFGGCVVRFAPSGEVDRVVEMPVTNITNCVFGGTGLRTLYVTTASLSTPAEEPLAGHLFAFEPGVRGLPDHTFLLV